MTLTLQEQKFVADCEARGKAYMVVGAPRMPGKAVMDLLHLLSSDPPKPQPKPQAYRRITPGDKSWMTP